MKTKLLERLTRWAMNRYPTLRLAVLRVQRTEWLRERRERRERLARAAARRPARPARPAPLPPVRPVPLSHTISGTPVRPATKRRTPKKSKGKKQGKDTQTAQPQVIVVTHPGYGSTGPTPTPNGAVLQGSTSGQGSMSPEQAARWITEQLATRRGSALEVSSLVQTLGALGTPQQVVQAGLWHAHAAGWVKKSGKGRVAATARTVRAGGVPEDRRRKVG